MWCPVISCLRCVESEKILTILQEVMTWHSLPHLRATSVGLESLLCLSVVLAVWVTLLSHQDSEADNSSIIVSASQDRQKNKRKPNDINIGRRVSGTNQVINIRESSKNEYNFYIVYMCEILKIKTILTKNCASKSSEQMFHYSI